METTWFTLGVLAMIMVMLIAVVIIGMVKVFRMHRQITNLYSYQNDIERHLNDRLRDVLRNTDEYNTNVYSHISDQITDAVTQAKSHTDSRIDKLIDTYFAVKEAEENTKKLIKG